MALFFPWTGYVLCCLGALWIIALAWREPRLLALAKASLPELQSRLVLIVLSANGKLPDLSHAKPDIWFFGDFTSTVTAFGRSRPAADASREANGAVVACWLR
jgi:hypothetical protein